MKSFYLRFTKRVVFFLVLALCSELGLGANFFISPNGNDNTGKGTIDFPWFTLNKAWAAISSGDTVYLRGGVYSYSSRQTLSGKNGNAVSPIKVFAYQNEKPILTKSGSFTIPSWPVTLVYLQGNYTHWYNIEITGFTQATSTIWYGMAVRNSNNNIFERIDSHHNGHGMVIRDNSSNNLVLNCDFHENYDPLTSTPYDNADGLEVGYLDDSAVNSIVGCRFYYNSDDGLDLWSNNGNVIVENCWAFGNGYREDKTTAGGNGNGIKLGGTTTADGTQFRRTIKNNLSFNNRSFGIAQNDANCKMYYLNNTVFANKNTGFVFYSTDNLNIFKNNISFSNQNGNYSGMHANSIVQNNSYDAGWQPTGPVVSVSDFVSVDPVGVADARQSNGDLPDLNFLKLSANSKLIDKGADVGIHFYGIAPDLGAFESFHMVAKYSTEYKSICEGSNYNGWTVAGTYERTLKTNLGSDSIVTTVLTVNPVYSINEEVTINSGESYQGWTTTGSYSRKLTSVAGCDSTVVTNLTVVNNTIKQGSIAPSHFIPVWYGENGLNHMNLMVVSATLEDIPLSANDEIAVFSGSLCVGSAKLALGINPDDLSTYLAISASQNDGSNDGFTDNDTIIFKIWDHQDQKEMIAKAVKYRNEIPAWLTNGKYVAGGTSVVEIVSYTEFTQSINLVKGYNMISTYLEPKDTMVCSLTQPLVDDGTLVKVQDETGNSYENWGTFGGWINKVGSVKKTEGYKIKVTTNCTLQVTGRPIALPLDIYLKAGWNIISFPRTDLIDALSIVQPLIDQNKLVKVQDEKGNSIEDWGIFGGWKNGIGNFIPGKAYKVKMSADAILTIQENYMKSAVIMADVAKTGYFISDVEGNGTDHMNINMVELREAGFSVGDEVAAFDGDICVGTLKLTENHIYQNSASVVASLATEENSNSGFKPGNKIRLFSWSTITGNESEIQMELVKGQLSFEKNSSVFARLKSLTTSNSGGNSLQIATKIYPNPSKGQVTISFSELPEIGSKLEVLDPSGKRILSRSISGMSEELNLEQHSAGIYFVKSVIGSKEEMHKLILN